MQSVVSTAGADQDLRRRVEELERELAEAHRREAATAEVLNVVRRSSTQLQPVLDAIIKTASRLCQSDNTYLFTLQDGKYRAAAHDAPTEPEFLAYIKENPIDPEQRGSTTARAARERCIIHVPDTSGDPEYGTGPISATKHRTVLSVPLLLQDATVGVITLDRLVVNPFSRKQIELLQTFADQAVIAIENTRMFEEAQARTRELQESLEYQTATSEVLKIINGSPLESQPVLESIVRTADRLCQADYAFALKLDDGHYRLAATSRVAEDFKQFLIDHPINPDRAVLRRTVHVHDAVADPNFNWRNAQEIGRFRTILSVPLMRNGAPIGVFALGRTSVHPFATKQIDLVRSFADQAVIAIENTRLFEAEQVRTRELSEALEQQTATSEILQVISNSPTEVQPVFDAIVRSASALCGGEHAIVTRYDGALLHLAAQHNPRLGADDETAKFYPQVPRRDGSISGRALIDTIIVHVADIDTEEVKSSARDAYRRMGLQAAIAVPMVHEGRPIGVVSVSRGTPGPFLERQIDLLRTFADQAVIAIENSRLFEEVQSRTLELAKTVEDLEIASQHKSQFVANMSHELRTPLAAILGYAELMQEGFYEPQGKKSLDALTRIRSNGKHLLGLINTVLDIAKIESGQFSLNLGEYAIETVVETVRAATESLAETKKLALKTDVTKKLPVGLGDEQRLTQVLLNLVGNAIKFTDTGEVRITATAVSGQFTVAVTDTGPGIPANELKRVFEQFHQIDNSSTKAKGGTGLGLAIAKQIVEMHGGRILVESTLGQGATFQMQLPIRAEAKKVAV